MPPWLDDLFWTYQNLVYALGVNGLLALSMYVVLAVGQLSLGQAAFMGLGAYSSAIMTVKLKLPFLLVLPASVVVPVLFALAIGVPTLRLAGVYLAIATIGLGEVLRATYLNLDYVGGALGLSGIPERASATMIYGILAAAILALWLVGRSRIGRAMEAMREDETAAQVIGVPRPPLQDGRAAGVGRPGRAGRMPVRPRLQLHRPQRVWVSSPRSPSSPSPSSAASAPRSPPFSAHGC